MEGGKNYPRRKMRELELKYSPVTFKKWLMVGIKKCLAEGAEIEFVPCAESEYIHTKIPHKNDVIKIKWSAGTVTRTIEDFFDEYENEYLPRFY